MAQPGPRKTRIAAILGAVFLFYLSGLIVRHSCGIAVIVRNQSGESLRDASIKVEHRGARYPLRVLPPGESQRVYVQPMGESSIELQFTDVHGQPRAEVLAAYVESGNSGRATATVLPSGQVDSQDDTFEMIGWKSWLDFIW